MMIVVGGYNSSNTSHLAEMSQELMPTYFIRNASKILSDKAIRISICTSRKRSFREPGCRPPPCTSG